MTDIEEKALELLNVPDWPYEYEPDDHPVKVLCRALEQHEAFKQEVSDAVEAYLNPNNRIYSHSLNRFIIPKRDPLAGVLEEVFSVSAVSGRINAALEARGLEIRVKGQ
jgi:hypothetical protein